MERHTYGADTVRGHTDTLDLRDYGDDIDEYPEYGDRTSANGNGDPSRRGPGTCAS